eukprot:7379306-Prymnesium_polylepis.4
MPILGLGAVARVRDTQLDVDAHLDGGLNHLRAHVSTEAISKTQDMLTLFVDVYLKAWADHIAHPAPSHLGDKPAALVRVERGYAWHSLLILEA